MAADSDEPLTQEEKVQIVKNFILRSPPGEFNEVFSDVRVLLNDDNLLKEQASSAFRQYYKEQLTPVKIKGSDHQVLVTDHNELESGRFFDDRSKKTFVFDDLKKEAFDYKVWTSDLAAEPWRAALERELDTYVSNHYNHGVCSVFGKSQGNIISLIACIEDHLFQPKSFWNGCWRSQWNVALTSNVVVALRGILKVQVHYYEDGNVQLVSSKEVVELIEAGSSQELAEAFVRVVENAENEYQHAITESYQTMSDTTFKALRRQLPVTRAKIDWNKLLSYRIMKELPG